MTPGATRVDVDRRARLGTIGWIGWATFILSVLVITVAAGIERRQAICGGEGAADPRRWEFALVPFGQTCGTPPPAQAALLMTQTLLVYPSLAVALMAGLFALARRGDGRPPMIARSLVAAQVSGVLLGAAVVTPAIVEPGGRELFGTLAGVSVALALAAAATATVCLVRLGRSTA